MAVLTRGLTNFRNQVNVRFPSRDKKSDGWISDDAHKLRTSGHNEDDTAGSRPAWDGDSDSTAEVRAYDMDKDLGEPGVTMQQLVDHVRKLPGVATVIRYIIYNGKIYHSRDGFAPATYTGDNQHGEHGHFEGAWTQAGDNNDTFDFQLDKLGDDVSKQDVLDALADPRGKALILSAFLDQPYGSKAYPSRTGRDYLRDTHAERDYDIGDGKGAAYAGVKVGSFLNVVGAMPKTLAAMSEVLALVAAKVAADDQDLPAIMARLDALSAQVDAVDDEVLAGLGSGQSIEQAAEMIRQIYGDEKAAALGEQLRTPVQG